MNSMFRFLTVYFAITCILGLSYKVNATTYYVAADGADASMNGSLLSPFLTIQYGTDQLTPGDSLVIRGGSYFENIFLNVSGTVGTPITIVAYPNEMPIIDGMNTGGVNLFVINSKSNIRIEGLIFQNKYVPSAKGIYVLGEGENITINACEIRNIGWSSDAQADPTAVNPIGQAHGILVNGRTTIGISGVSITNCIIHDIVSGNSEALTLAGNVSDFEIAHTDVFATTNIGIDIAGHYIWAVDTGVDATLNQSRNGSVHHCEVYDNRRISDFDAPAGIYADGAKNVMIYNNVVHDNGNGFSIGCENAGFTASNIVVVNNLVYNNDIQGAYFGSNASSITDCILKNNTFVGNGTTGIFLSEVSLQNSTNCIVTQNILIPRVSSNYAVSIFGYNVSNLTVDNNLAYRFGGDLTDLYVHGTPAQFTETNSIFENPAFTDSLIASLDINLKETSSAIDKGSLGYSTYINTDINNSFRTVNGKLDLGASESQTGDCPDVITINDTYTLKGLFVARDSVIFDLDQLTISDDIIINCPFTSVISSILNAAQITIMADGCGNN